MLKDSYPKVAIIILNWNGWKDTIECLESLYQITYPNYDVVVVDNGSEDDSVDKIKEYCEGKIEVKSKFFEYSSENKPIKIIEYTREEAEAGGGKEKEIADLPSNRKMILIKNEKNYGFAEGNNIGMRYALKALNPDYVLLLNNDTVVDKEFLGELVKVGESDEKIGILSPFVYWYEYPDEIQHGGEKVGIYRLTSVKLWKKIPSAETIISETAAGPCMLISKENIKKTGLLPLGFSFMLADIGYSFSSRKNGFEIISVRKARIWHKTSTSVQKVKPLAIKNQIREGIIFRHRFMKRHQFLIRLFLSVFIYWPLLSIKLTISSHDVKLVKSCWEGVIGGIVYLIRRH